MPRLPELGRRTAALVALGAAAALIAAGCSGGTTAGDGSGGGGGGDGRGGQVSKTRFVAGHGTVTTVSPGDRDPAPEVSGRDLDGKRLRLSDYRGKIVVINVWGSWCPPCRKEAPALGKAARALADHGVAFLGINTRDNDPGPARAFDRTFDMPYPSVYDPRGELLLGFRDVLPPSAIPSTLVIDARGRVAARVLGPVTYRTITGIVGDIAADRGPGR